MYVSTKDSFWLRSRKITVNAPMQSTMMKTRYTSSSRRVVLIRSSQFASVSSVSFVAHSAAQAQNKQQLSMTMQSLNRLSFVLTVTHTAHSMADFRGDAMFLRRRSSVVVVVVLVWSVLLACLGYGLVCDFEHCRVVDAVLVRPRVLRHG